MEAGADIHYINDKGIGALYLAIKGKSRVLIQYMVNLQAAIYYT